MEDVVLEKLGMSKLEAKIYLALLQLGEPSVIEISRKSKIGRTQVYGILESLIKKGLVSFVMENKTKKFRAAEPAKILNQLKETEAAFMEILPRLNKMSELKEKKEPTIDVFRGIRGMKAMITEILEVKKDYCIIAEDLRNQKLNFFITHFEKSIERENIGERFLIKKRADIIRSKNMTVRFLPEKYSYQATTIIYGDRVGILICTDPFVSIRIKSREIASTYQNYFEILWAVSKTK